MKTVAGEASASGSDGGSLPIQRCNEYVPHHVAGSLSGTAK
jgi:hypothetical protein